MKVFNAVIEGIEDPHRSKNCSFKITRLEIPGDVFVINDGTNEFHFYGKTLTFKEVKEMYLCVGKLDARVDRLNTCPGIIFPYKGEVEHILQAPRAILLRDRRVFIENSMRQDKKYFRLLNKSIVQEAGEIFSDRRLPERLKRIVDNLEKDDYSYFRMFSN